MLSAGIMCTETKLSLILVLFLAFLLWREVQGRCASCPSNGCSQTGMSQGWAVLCTNVWSYFEVKQCLSACFNYRHLVDRMIMTTSTSLHMCSKCYRARYYQTSYQSSNYVTTYYTTSSGHCGTRRCGWLGWKRCRRCHTNYHQRYKDVFNSVCLQRWQSYIQRKQINEYKYS